MSTQSTEISVVTKTPSVEQVRRGLLLGMQRLSASARRIYRLRSLMLWFVYVTLGTLALVFADMIFRWDELGLRWLASATWLLLITGVGAWLLVPAWQFEPTPVELAQRIERTTNCDGLVDALEVSSVAKDDWRFGSPTFRNAFLVDWRKRHDGLDLYSQLSSRRLWESTCLLGVVIVGLIVFVAVKPTESRLALTRLMLPWSPQSWPRENLLRILNAPNIVALGSSLEIEVTDDRGQLPEYVELVVRSAEIAGQGETATRYFPMRNLRTVAVASIANIDQAIEIRAIGGDDSHMPWRRIAVGAAPELSEQAFSIQPPTYTGQANKELVGSHIEVLSGTRVSFRGTFVAPVRSVEVMPISNSSVANASVGDRSNASTADSDPSLALSTNQWIASLDNAGRNLTLIGLEGTPLLAEHSLTWRLQVTTGQGLELTYPTTWTMNVRNDQPPLVVFQQLDSPLTSSQSLLHVRGQASDDLALESVSLSWELNAEQAPEQGSIALWKCADVLRSPEENVNSNPAGINRLEIDSELTLAEHLAPADGQKYTLWLEARDNHGQVTRSQPQSVEVRSSQDVAAELQNEQSKIFDQLQQLVQLERRNLQLAQRTDAVVRESKMLRRDEIDALAGIAQLQKSIEQGLAAESSSVLADIDALLERVRLNRLEKSDSAQQLMRLREHVAAAAASSLAHASSASQQAAAQARSASTNDPSMTAKISESTGQVVSSIQKSQKELEALAKQLAESESAREVRRELAQVLNRQQELKREVSQLEITQSGNGNSLDIEAGKTGLRADQLGLARSLDELMAQAKSLLNKQLPVEPEVEQSIESARQSIVSQQLSQAMREAAEKINHNQFSEAAAIQQRVADSLHQSLRMLSPSAEDSLADLLADSQAASGKLADLADRQKLLAEQIKATNANSSSAQALADRQAELHSQTDRLVRQLEHQRSTTESQMAATARDHQLDASTEASKGHMDAATLSAQAAAEELARAAQSSAARSQRLASELAQQQMFQMDVALDQLVRQQTPIVTDLDKTPDNGSESDSTGQHEESSLGKESAVQMRSNELRLLAMRQEAVRQMVQEVRQQANQLAAFSWVLSQAENDMQRSVAAIQRNRIRPEAHTAADAALRKLQIASTALGHPNADSQSASSQAADSPPDSEPHSESKKPTTPPVASLKLLRGLQAEVNRETRQLDEDKALLDSVGRATRLGQLSVQQRSLGQQVQELVEQIRNQQSRESVQ